MDKNMGVRRTNWKTPWWVVSMGAIVALPALAQDWTAGESLSEPLSSIGQGPEMVVIPAGQFRMGCSGTYLGWACEEDHRGRFTTINHEELPAHDVRIVVTTSVPQPFTIVPTPPDATVRFVAGTDRAYEAGMELLAGDYRIEVSAPGYESERVLVALTSGRGSRDTRKGSRSRRLTATVRC